MTTFKSKNAKVNALCKVYFTANLSDSDISQEWQNEKDCVLHCRVIDTILRSLLTESEVKEIFSTHEFNGKSVENTLKTERGYINTIQKLIRTFPEHSEILLSILGSDEDPTPTPETAPKATPKAAPKVYSPIKTVKLEEWDRDQDQITWTFSEMGLVSGFVYARRSQNENGNKVIASYEIEFDQDEIEDSLFEIHGDFYNKSGGLFGSNYMGGLFRQSSPYKTATQARKAAKGMICHIVNTKIKNKEIIERWIKRASFLKQQIISETDYVTIPDFDRDAVHMKEHGKFLDEEDLKKLDDIVMIRQKCLFLIRAKTHPFKPLVPPPETAPKATPEPAPKAASPAVEIKPRPMGRQSHGNVSKMVSLRIPVDLMDLLEAKAKETGTTRSSVILSILDSALNPRTPDLASIASPLCEECGGTGEKLGEKRFSPCQRCFPPLEEDHCDDRPTFFNIS